MMSGWQWALLGLRQTLKITPEELSVAIEIGLTSEARLDVDKLWNERGGLHRVLKEGRPMECEGLKGKGYWLLKA